MNKIFGFFLLVVFSVAAFADPELHAVPAKDTLSLWVMDDGVNSGFALQKITRKYSQQTKKPVKVRFLNWGEAFDELQRVFAMDSSEVEASGAEVPDVVQLGSSWVPYFADAGMISSIDSLLDVVDSTRFYSEAMKATHVGRGKETYALPWFLDVRGLFVNERLWLSMGFNDEDVENFPEFYGTLRSVAKAQLKNGYGRPVTAFEFGVREDWTAQQQMAPILWSFGGDLVVECEVHENDSSRFSGYRSALVDSASLVGLRHYLKFVRDQEISPNGLRENSSQIADRFVRSEMLMIHGTSEIIRKMEFGSDVGGLMESPLAKDGIAVIPSPKGPAGRFTFVGGSHLALPKLLSYRSAQRQKEAADLFLFLLRADNVDQYSRQIGFLPADRSLIHLWAQDSRYYQLINGLEKDGRSFINIPEWREVEVVMNNMVGRIAKSLADTSCDESDEIPRVVLAAHEQIDSLLRHESGLDRDSLWACIRLALMQPVEEHENEIREEPQETERPLFVVLVAAAALVLVVVVIVVVLRRKR
ncbi:MULTISPECIES: extracellular solute-binding protein [unclassified Fibrobacter]|uniref:extracellular solute-binding protein n=1 Tax=unclassified Fibrobacter TaxID=2634177 RepID=UPI000916FD6D|nr:MULTISPECIES: extracellular solute-binding protein [unclassified Fibrobacter]SHL47675.1 multiple sugar transport system substrate-binding protein [Fibrobacter sp. UWH6]